jgi:hypothetical protein
LLKLLMTRRAFERYVSPAIADMQTEYVEALAADRKGLAKWIALRGHFYLIPGWLYGLLAAAMACWAPATR